MGRNRAKTLVARVLVWCLAINRIQFVLYLDYHARQSSRKTGQPNLSRNAKFSGGNGNKKKSAFLSYWPQQERLATIPD